ncbi:hypothetical protein QUG78_29400, partial [Klebsiella michiganensis]|nr:hypothetical protein [Klebsiella michiganensis]
MGSCAAPSAKGDDKFITTDYLQQCLLELFEAGKVKEVTIERVSLKKWYPVFQIDDEQLGQIACSIRV